MNQYCNIFITNKRHFIHGGKGTFQNYNTDQKAAIKALPQTADQNDYYLFFVECYDRLDTAGNKSLDPVAGYMPVGRHYGFIYNEYTNARTIAHELAHGTNALHHTFSQESETFYTTEKTDNLMDYNGGTNLNHKQWQWAHEKHRNVLGFLDDEGESEAKVDNNEKILSILKEIREAYQNDKSLMELSVNQSMSYVIDVPKVDFSLGNGKLSYLKIDVENIVSIDAKKSIRPSELSEVVAENEGFTKIVFHKASSVGIGTDIEFSIIVKTEEKQVLIDYIHPYKITTEQLSNIYPDASAETIKAVSEAINKYCNEFEINTPERMAHFLGQIGAETGSKLNQLSENSNYSARRIVEIFGYTKYGHLFEEAELNSTTYNYAYTPINYSCTLCANGAIDKNGSSFSLNRSEIINAYAEEKAEKEVIINGITTKKMLFNDAPRTDVTAKNISTIVKNAAYNEGKLRIKMQYINSVTLFDVTYACRMGNGAIETRDGSIYKGVGFIHLTGKSNYKSVVDEWNRMHPDDQLTLNQELIEKAKTDVDLAMKLAMAYWKMSGLNSYINERSEVNNDDILKISAIVNVGHTKNITESDINGYDTRKNATIKSYNILNEK